MRDTPLDTIVDASYVISSRARCARNLRNYPSPASACQTEQKAVVEYVRATLATMPWCQEVTCLQVEMLRPIERRVLEEKQLISPLFARQENYRLAIIAKTCEFSILVNEEDHLRIQSVQPGLQLREAWQTTSHLETTLQEKLDFAYSDQQGYLATCSSNGGAGIRLSVMLFLPGLILLKWMTPIVQRLVASGYAVRGLYGEGSPSRGYVLQISTQVAYRSNERAILTGLERICGRIIEQEKLARFHLLAVAGNKLYTRIEQVWETLARAKQVTFIEGMRMVALLRLGRSLGLKNCRQISNLDAVGMSIQPAHILTYGRQFYQRKHGASDDEDALRATMLRHYLRIGEA